MFRSQMRLAHVSMDRRLDRVGYITLIRENQRRVDGLQLFVSTFIVDHNREQVISSEVKRRALTLTCGNDAYA
jgi:hypothetical protein